VTNNLNSLADGVRCPLDFAEGPDRRPLVPLADAESAAPEVRALFEDARTFYAMERPPAVLRVMARDPALPLAFGAPFRPASSRGPSAA